jgi:hypothetical protein
LDTVDAVYSSLGMALDDQTRTAIAAYVETHPKGSFGVHGYNLAEFGLNGDELAERFSGYVERYRIPVERARV